MWNVREGMLAMEKIQTLQNHELLMRTTKKKCVAAGYENNSTWQMTENIWASLNNNNTQIATNQANNSGKI